MLLAFLVVLVPHVSFATGIDLAQQFVAELSVNGAPFTGFGADWTNKREVYFDVSSRVSRIVLDHCPTVLGGGTANSFTIMADGSCTSSIGGDCPEIEMWSSTSFAIERGTCNSSSTRGIRYTYKLPNRNIAYDYCVTNSTPALPISVSAGHIKALMRNVVVGAPNSSLFSVPRWCPPAK